MSSRVDAKDKINRKMKSKKTKTIFGVVWGGSKFVNMRGFQNFPVQDILQVLIIFSWHLQVKRTTIVLFIKLLGPKNLIHFYVATI